MEKCHKHNKELVGGCMWCGKRMCDYCIARKEGLKIYCEICAQNLGPPRRTIPKVEPKQAPVVEERRVEPIKRRKPDKDGYFDFTQIRQ
ncbi:MAG TPA: hypothetical protein VLJ21_01460 [Candidatus Binatia bacterium]|nr:hypothetical protein [Candidatus Binatia bacterium]